jgi:hypothetical protein
MPKNINVIKNESNQKNSPWLTSATGKGLNDSLTNENHWAFLKTKVNEYHCQKKDNNQNNSPWLKLGKGRSFDNLPLSFTFTLFHNNNNNNLSKPYFRKKMWIIKEKTKIISTTWNSKGEFFWQIFPLINLHRKLFIIDYNVESYMQYLSCN